MRARASAPPSWRPSRATRSSPSLQRPFPAPAPASRSGRRAGRQVAPWPATWRACAERGATLPEFALTFPALVLVLLTLLQFALVVHAQHVVTASAQEGARVAATFGRTPQEGQDYALSLLRAGLGENARTFAVAVAPEGQGGDVTVATVGGTFPLYVPLPGGGVLIRATARVRTEQFRPGRW